MRDIIIIIGLLLIAGLISTLILRKCGILLDGKIYIRDYVKVTGALGASSIFIAVARWFINYVVFKPEVEEVKVSLKEANPEAYKAGLIVFGLLLIVITVFHLLSRIIKGKEIDLLDAFIDSAVELFICYLVVTVFISLFGNTITKIGQAVLSIRG